MMMYDELIEELRRHHCDAKEDDTQEICEECAYDVIIADKNALSGIASVCVCGLMHRAADAIEELSMKLHGDEAAIAGMKREIERMVVADKPRWIPVSERLPEFKVNDGGVIHTSTVLYRRGKEKTVHLGYVIKTTVVNSNTEEIFVFNRWYDQYGELWEDVTHWMPLPEPPKEAEECES